MDTLKDWTKYYIDNHMWVVPARDTLDFNWMHWRNMKEADYIKESESFNYTDARMVYLITGKKGMCTLYFPRDADSAKAFSYTAKVLDNLKLPHRYEWVFQNDKYIFIVFDVSGNMQDIAKMKSKDLYILFERPVILPPGIRGREDEKYEYTECKEWAPLKRPSQVSSETLKNCMIQLRDTELSDKRTQKEKDIEKLKITSIILVAIAIATLIVVGIFASIMGMDLSDWIMSSIVTYIFICLLVWMMNS